MRTSNGHKKNMGEGFGNGSDPERSVKARPVLHSKLAADMNEAERGAQLAACSQASLHEENQHMFQAFSRKSIYNKLPPIHRISPLSRRLTQFLSSRSLNWSQQHRSIKTTANMAPPFDAFFKQCVEVFWNRLYVADSIKTGSTNCPRLSLIVSNSAQTADDWLIMHPVGLRKAVAIPSVSADDERRPDVVKA